MSKVISGQCGVVRVIVIPMIGSANLPSLGNTGNMNQTRPPIAESTHLYLSQDKGDVGPWSNENGVDTQRDDLWCPHNALSHVWEVGQLLTSHTLVTSNFPIAAVGRDGGGGGGVGEG